MTPSEQRARVIEVAQAEIGPQGKGSIRVEAYWREVLPKAWTDAQVHLYSKTRDWCGGFALWCLHQVGLGEDIDWIDGKGFLFRLPRTVTPSRGDIGYLNAPFQHHLLFVYEHDGWIHSVDGNQPGVKEQRRRRGSMDFYSIEPLLTRMATDPAPPLTRPLLRQGDHGEAVKELQALLARITAPGLTVDGSFGPKTLAAVMSFQRRAGLSVDGVVGRLTWEALDGTGV